MRYFKKYTFDIPDPTLHSDRRGSQIKASRLALFLSVHSWISDPLAFTTTLGDPAPATSIVIQAHSCSSSNIHELPEYLGGTHTVRCSAIPALASRALSLGNCAFVPREDLSSSQSFKPKR